MDLTKKTQLEMCQPETDAQTDAPARGHLKEKVFFYHMTLHLGVI